MNGQPDRPDIETDDSARNDADVAASDEEVDVEAAIASLQQKVEENWDLYLRAAAEAENARKRARRDVEHARRYALENFSKELLGVKDSLEMGLAVADKADPEALIAGSEATLKLLTTTLERFGVEEVDPEGEPFNPELHEAMTVQPSDKAEPGSVLTVIQKGYSLNGRLLRPARVIVAADAADTPARE